MTLAGVRLRALATANPPKPPPTITIFGAPLLTLEKRLSQPTFLASSKKTAAVTSIHQFPIGGNSPCRDACLGRIDPRSARHIRRRIEFDADPGCVPADPFPDFG